MRIIGTGIDIIEVQRIAQATERWGDNFLNHVFCPEEIAYARTKKFPEQHLTGRFAAKEAIFKALGDNYRLNWCDMKILNDLHGRPYCIMALPDFIDEIHLTISHTKNYAVANAIITTRSESA